MSRFDLSDYTESPFRRKKWRVERGERRRKVGREKRGKRETKRGREKERGGEKFYRKVFLPNLMTFVINQCL